MKTVKICEEANIKINGRTIESRDPVRLVWTGSSIEFNIKASECQVLVEAPYDIYEGWIAIEINGEIIQRRPLNKEKEWITVFRMMNSENVHTVRIIKEVQAMSGDASHSINFYEIRYDGEILPPEERPLKLEFIGDSITSGEGCIGAHNEMDWISMVFAHTRSYPYIISKKLNADYRVFSQSGWGLSRSWDNRPECALPKYYEEICSLLPEGDLKNKGFNEKNDFSSFKSDAIIVNLGTNDDGAFHNEAYTDENGISHKLHMDGDKYVAEDMEIVKKACYDFLTVLRKNNANARIYWAFGILGDSIGYGLREAIDLYNRKNNDNVKFISIPNTTEEGFGSRMHPGKKSHKQAAKAISNVLKQDFSLS